MPTGFEAAADNFAERGPRSLAAPMIRSAPYAGRSALSKKMAFITAVNNSESQFCREFEIARVARSNNRSEGGRSEAPVRIIERRRIGHIERFGAHVESNALRDAEYLADHEVGVLQARPAHRIAGTAADDELRGGLKCCRIEPLPRTAVGKLVGISNAVGPLNREAEA